MKLNPLTYALLAEEAYHATPQIGEESSAARAILEDTIDGLAVAFPGTNNLACWLADLNTEVVQVPGLGGLHAGFRNAFLQIRDRLFAALATGGRTAVPCGHSEGAALALNFAGELCLAGKPPPAVFAFEPPRVSIDDTLGELLAANGVQVFLTCLGNDVVPLVPLRHPWRHPTVLKPIGRAALPFPNVEDHQMARVVEAVRAFVTGSELATA